MNYAAAIVAAAVVNARFAEVRLRAGAAGHRSPVVIRRSSFVVAVRRSPVLHLGVRGNSNRICYNSGNPPAALAMTVAVASW